MSISQRVIVRVFSLLFSFSNTGLFFTNSVEQLFYGADQISIMTRRGINHLVVFVINFVSVIILFLFLHFFCVCVCVVFLVGNICFQYILCVCVCVCGFQIHFFNLSFAILKTIPIFTLLLFQLGFLCFVFDHGHDHHYVYLFGHHHHHYYHQSFHFLLHHFHLQFDIHCCCYY